MPGLRNSLGNRDTLASPRFPHKTRGPKWWVVVGGGGGVDSLTNKEIKALPCLFIGLFMSVRILERLSRLLMGTGYSIRGLHVEF